jgi:diguanylate cyclase (GGDEF)-like protein
MSLAQWLLLMLCLQLALYGVGWACAAVFLPSNRRVVVELLTFTLANALALGLLVARGHVPDWLGRTTVDLLFLLGFVMVWRGAQRFLKGHVSREPLLVLAAGGAAIVWFSVVQVNADARVLCLLVSLSWVALRAPWLGYGAMRAEFGPRTALSLGVTGCAVAGALLSHGIGSYLSGRPLEWSQGNSMHPGFPFFFMGAAALVNLGLALQMFTRMVRQLRHLSRHDSLTGLLNRHAFMSALAAEWQRYQRRPQVFAVLAFDVDHFKSVNDNHGHATGDEVLAELGALLRRHARQTDHVGRSGGEEFLLLLVGDDLQQAGLTAERLRAAVAERAWPGALSITVSVGVAVVQASDVSETPVLRRADQALYAAKSQGRNRVVISGAPAAPTARFGVGTPPPIEV